jgi:cation diffusion facilitator CzcD-associated flavoprotein CzcO
MKSTQASRSALEGPIIARSLAELEIAARRDLAYSAYPTPHWVPARLHNGQLMLDVAIVGAGQGGLATAFGLMREQITNIQVFDRNPQGLEGPWVTFARMITLRTPKHITGPEYGIASLTPRAWYEARYGASSWAALDKIPREDWQDYLQWFRRVTDIPVQNDANIVAITPEGDALRLTVVTPTGTVERFARKVVLATGIDGSGRWEIPVFISRALPPDRFAHTAQDIDFGRLAGRRIGVLGAGASAFDNAATALEAGTGSVDLCVRRHDIPRVNPYRWMESAGFLGHYAEMSDIMRWRFMRHIFELNQPPPQDTFWRCQRHANFAYHTGCPWTSVAMQGAEIAVATPLGDMRFDFLIVGTGFVIDLQLRPELAAIADKIAAWADRFTPPAGEESALLSSHPYLGDAFQFTERVAGTAPYLANIHNFTFGATPSMGLSGASISGMKYGVRRLVAGLARDLYLDDAHRHLASLLAYNTPELVSTECEHPPTPQATPAPPAG